MKIEITVVAGTRKAETFWIHELGNALGNPKDVIIRGRSQLQEEHGLRELSYEENDTSQAWFVDADLPALDQFLVELDRTGKAVFLMVRDDASLPEAFISGRVDDLLVHPFRPVELVSRLKTCQQILMWQEVHRMNHSFAGIVDKLQDDLKLAERLQKGKLPLRFDEVKGFKVGSRYLAGLRAGGDHFDLADSRDGSQMSVILSDASSYGLAGAVLSAMMSVALKLSATEVRSASDTVGRIYQELLNTLKEKDRLSLFYGVISRKDLKLRYLNLGTSCAFYSAPGEKFRALPSQGAPLTRAGGAPQVVEAEITPQPSDRLCLISDGFVEVIGGPEKMCEFLDRFRDADPKDVLNELAFQTKKNFVEADDMPEQDSTAVIFDTDSRILRLAAG